LKKERESRRQLAVHVDQSTTVSGSLMTAPRNGFGLGLVEGDQSHLQQQQHQQQQQRESCIVDEASVARSPGDDEERCRVQPLECDDAREDGAASSAGVLLRYVGKLTSSFVYHLRQNFKLPAAFLVIERH